ncbi:MAG: hypothetical protein ACXWYO_00045 [Gaiellaceae bacterium]
MASIRVVLIDMPKMLHDVVSELIAGSPGIEVVPDQVSADVVVAGAEAVRCEPFERLLGGRERLAVLTIDREGRDSRLYALRRLGEVSTEELVATIRTAAGVH